MTDGEKILYFRSLEKSVAEAEAEVERMKGLLKRAKETYDGRVNELRSAIRRDDAQMELHMTDAQVIDESRQLPAHEGSAQEQTPSDEATPFASNPGDAATEPTLPTNPGSIELGENDGEAEEDDPPPPHLSDEEMEIAALRTRKAADKGSANAA